MIKPGHIEIQDNKVIFVYHELKKPKREEHYTQIEFEKAVNEYKASKREVEVRDVPINITDKVCFIQLRNRERCVKHNQPCEAEVNGKAVITKIL